MANRHPYSPGFGGVKAAISQLQNSFPSTVTSETLKKLGIAPKNESYIINILRFIGAIDEEGKKTEDARRVFSKSGEDFEKDFEGMIKTSYADLFALHGDAAWALPTDKLKAFFRHSDQTTDLVGMLQAATFQLLATFAGHAQVPAPTQPTQPKPLKITPAKKNAPAQVAVPAPLIHKEESTRLGLTVRVEVNLPPGGDQETYDRIFRSIRENLLNGK